MNTYYLRTTDYPTLLQLGAKLGVISLYYAQYHESESENGLIVRTPIGDPFVTATDGGCFDYIGEIHKPTGEVDEDDNSVMAPITDEQGTPFIHANLITPHDIRALATASDDADIQAALSQIAQWFVTDDQGNPTTPAVPHRVFA